MSDYVCPPSPQTYTRSITRPRARMDTLFSCLAGTTRAWLHVHGACARTRSVWQPLITQTGGYQSLPYSFMTPKTRSPSSSLLYRHVQLWDLLIAVIVDQLCFSFRPPYACIQAMHGWVGVGVWGWFHIGRIIPYIGHLSKSIKNNYWLSSSHFIPYRLGKRTYF